MSTLNEINFNPGQPRDNRGKWAMVMPTNERVGPAYETPVLAYGPMLVIGPRRYVLRLTNESGMARVAKHFSTGDFGLISGEKKGMTHAQSKDVSKRLQHRIRQMGYGYIPVKGQYRYDSGELAHEPSYLVPHISRSHLHQLSKEFDQESVIRARHGKASAYYQNGKKADWSKGWNDASYNPSSDTPQTVLRSQNRQPTKKGAIPKSRQAFSFQASKKSQINRVGRQRPAQAGHRPYRKNPRAAAAYEAVRCIDTLMEVAPWIKTLPMRTLRGAGRLVAKAGSSVVDSATAMSKALHQKGVKAVLLTRIMRKLRHEKTETRIMFHVIRKMVMGLPVGAKEHRIAILQAVDLIKTVVLAAIMAWYIREGMREMMPAGIILAVEQAVRLACSRIFGVEVGIAPLSVFDKASMAAATMGESGIDDVSVWSAVTHIITRILDALRDGRLNANESLNEGLFDKNILKAVFLAGSGGSGKGFYSKKAFGDSGLKVVNSDEAFEYLMHKHGLDPKTDVGSPEAQELRPRSKEITGARLENYIEGRLGLIIDGTGDKPEKLLAQKRRLESLGYDTSMVLVNTPLDIALQHNQKRQRVVPENVVKEAWQGVQNAISTYRDEFGDRNFAQVDNGRVLTPEQVTKDLTPKLARAAEKLIGRPLENPVGHEWINHESRHMHDTTHATHRGKDAERRHAVAKQHDRPATRRVDVQNLRPETFRNKRAEKSQKAQACASGKARWVMVHGHPVCIGEGVDEGDDGFAPSDPLKTRRYMFRNPAGPRHMTLRTWLRRRRTETALRSAARVRSLRYG